MSQKELVGQQRAEQEKLFSNMKTDLIRELTGSIGTLEKDIMTIKNEQSKLDGLGKKSESEQKRIDMLIEKSEMLLRDH